MDKEEQKAKMKCGKVVGLCSRKSKHLPSEVFKGCKGADSRRIRKLRKVSWEGSVSKFKNK